ncbi:hypothetical protein BUZ48_01935 [Staphylococcus hominis]|nr:hypothetical protein BUZ48_01935 [Staphylococcus hominis]
MSSVVLLNLLYIICHQFGSFILQKHIFFSTFLFTCHHNGANIDFVSEVITYAI